MKRALRTVVFLTVLFSLSIYFMRQRLHNNAPNTPDTVAVASANLAAETSQRASSVGKTQPPDRIPAKPSEQKAGQIGGAGATEGNTTDHFAGATVLKTSETAPDKNGRYERKRLVRADFKYPLILLEESLQIVPQTGAEQILRQNAMVADHVMVKVQPGASEDEVNQAVLAYGGHVRKKMYAPDLYLVEFQNIDLDSVSQAVQNFGKDSGLIVYAEPDYIEYALSTTPNDPRFGELWGMHNTGQTSGTPDADIDAPEAWDITTGSSSILVAVIDSGIDYTHPDLSANMWINPGEAGTLSANGIDDDGNGFIDDYHGWDFYSDDNDSMDDNSHGTHCAGTIGAVGNNSEGVVGVCWNVSLIGLKFLGASGSGATSDSIDATIYAARLGARLISASYGGGSPSTAGYESIQTAAASNMLFIAAAGNDATNNDVTPHYPSSYTNANLIAVANSTSTDTLSELSCYGLTSVDLAAPGSSILSTIPSGGYGIKSGTSMATPHVAGAAALLWSYNPGLSAAEVKEALMANVDANAAFAGKMVSGGRLNVNKALRSLTGALSNVVGFAATAGTNQVSLFWSNPGDSEFSGVKIMRKTGGYPANENDGTEVYNGTGTEYIDTGLSAGTIYYYTAFAYDTSGNYASGSFASAIPIGFYYMLDLNFETNAVGAQPTGQGATFVPSANTAFNYIKVIGSPTNTAGTGNGVEFCDDSASDATRFECGLSSLQSVIRFDFSFSPLRTDGSGANYIHAAVIGGATLDRFCSLRLYDNGTIRFYAGAVAGAIGSYIPVAMGTSYKASMFLNDSTAPVIYTDPNGGEGTLAADSAEFWLDGVKIGGGELLAGISGTTNGLAKVWFGSNKGLVGLKYALDDIKVSQILPPNVLTVNNGTGGGLHTYQQQVPIAANAPVNGKTFDRWIGDTQYVASVTSSTTTVTMPFQTISLTATYQDAPYYTLTVNNGTGGGLYSRDQQVSINANDPVAGESFDRWIGDTQVVASITSPTTTVAMPAQDVTLTATYKNVFTLTVINGAGGGSYTNGQQVMIAANAPAIGNTFDQWIGDTQYVASVFSSITTVTMPAQAVALTATYKPGYPATLLNVDFESDTIGTNPVAWSAYVEPLTNQSDIVFVKVIGSPTNTAGTGQGVQIFDNDGVNTNRVDSTNGIGTQLSYDFPGGPVSSLRFDFSFCSSATNGTGTTNAMIFGVATNGAGMADSTNRFASVYVYASGTMRFSTANGIANKFYVQSNKYTVSMFLNDSDSSIAYIGPDGTTNALGANSVAHWLDGVFIVSGRFNNGPGDTTNGLGRVGVASWDWTTGLDFLIDNLVVSEITTSAPPVEVPLPEGLLLFEDYETGSIGSCPSHGNPMLTGMPANTNSGIRVVDAAMNTAATGKAVQLYDNDTSAGMGIEYNLVTNGVGLSAVRADFAFSWRNIVSGSGNYYMTVAFGEYSTTRSPAKRYTETRLGNDGMVDFVSAVSGTNNNNALAPFAANTMTIFANDYDSQSVNYTTNGTTYSLPANSVAYWLNGSLIMFGASEYASLDLSETNATGATIGTTENNLGKFGFASSTAAYGLDYIVDNIAVSELVPNMLTISSGGLSFRRSFDGSVVPASQIYTVSNAATASLDWTVTPSQSWVTVFPSGGTLPEGGYSDITVSINATADELPGGIYTNTLIFGNLLDAGAQTRAVQLTTIRTTNLVIQGATQLAAPSTNAYTCWAQGSDGSGSNMTDQVEWSLVNAESGVALSTNGFLSVGAISSNTIVIVQASYGGFTNTLPVALSVVAHLGFSTIASPQSAGTPFDVTLSAQDINGATVSAYQASVVLSAAGDSGPVTLTPVTAVLSNGVCTVSIRINTPDSNIQLTAIDDLGRTGSSNPFDVLVGPLDHFTWSMISNQQYVDASFPVTITAQDAGNNTVTGFVETAILTGWQDRTAGVRISEMFAGTPDAMEFVNVSDIPIDITGWQVFIYDYTSRIEGNPLPVFTIPAGSICPTGGVFRITEFGSAPGTYPLFYTGTNINWVSGSSFCGVLLRDAASNVVDFVAAGTLNPAAITNPVVVVPTYWQGSQVPPVSSNIYSHQRFGNSDTNTSNDWRQAVMSIGMINTGLIVPFAGSAAAVTITPNNTGSFVDGVWIGSVTVLESVSNMYLRADDGGGHSGTSGMFTVVNPTYPLTVNGGSGSGSYTNGRQVAISASNLTGKAFVQWIGDTQYVNNVTYTNALVTMLTNPVTLTATYVDAYYALTATAGFGGTVSPGNTNVAIGGDATFTITASNYYRISTLKTNDADVVGVAIDNTSTSFNYTWTDVQAAGTVTVAFVAQVVTNPAAATVPYSWMAGYGLTNYEAEAVLDQDCDGLATWQEYIAGTGPTNAASVLKAAQAVRNVITWSPTTGRVYSVYWATNLMNGFQPLKTNILYPQGNYTNTTPDSRINLYQIKVRLQ